MPKKRTVVFCPLGDEDDDDDVVSDNDDDVVSGEDDDVEKCKFVYPSLAHPSAAQ